MAKRPLEKAERWDYRTGKGGFAYGGMMMDPEPGTNPPTSPRLLVNARFQGGGIVSRQPYVPKIYINPNFRYDKDDPTLQTYNTSQWQPKWMEAHSPQNPKELWYGYFDSTAGGVIKRAAWSGDNAAKVVTQLPTLITRAAPVERYSGNIYVGDQNHLKRIFRAGDDGQGGAITLGSLPLDETIYTFPNGVGATRQVSVLHAHTDGKLYMCVDDQSLVTNTIVYSFDGAQLVEELDLGAAYAVGAAFSSIRGKLAFIAYEGAGDSTLHLKDLSGAWGSVSATGSGPPPNRAAFEGWTNGMTALAKNLYIACGDNGWWKYDDETGIFQKFKVCTGATVGTTISDRVFLTFNTGVGGAGYIEHRDIDGTYVIDWPWYQGTTGRKPYATAIAGVGRRIQLAGYDNAGLRYVSYGTPGAPINAGLKFDTPSNVSNTSYIEYYKEI